jgi:hypothetical protein
LGNISSLQFLRLAENGFIDMPDFRNTPMTSIIREIAVEKNQLTFEDLEPNINIAQELFTYSPQDSIGIEIDTIISTGANFEMSVFVGGDSNYYNWMKDSIDIPGANNSSFIIQSVDTSDAGTYTCRVTNSLATELAIYRRPIHLHISVSVPIMDNDQRLPKDFKLEQNFPNPFNPVTTIRFTIPKKSLVSLEVYNILGEKVATIYDDFLPAGVHEFNWSQSAEISSGVYWYRLQAGNYVETRKMVLVR